MIRCFGVQFGALGENAGKGLLFPLRPGLRCRDEGSVDQLSRRAFFSSGDVQLHRRTRVSPSLQATITPRESALSQRATPILRFRNSSKPTAAIITIPMITCCQYGFMPSRSLPLESKPMMKAPMRVPVTLPSPP